MRSMSESVLAVGLGTCTSVWPALARQVATVVSSMLLRASQDHCAYSILSKPELLVVGLDICVYL